MNAYAILLGGWSSNNKYSLLGGLRAAAQLISYEMALGLSLVPVFMIAGSLRLEDIAGFFSTYYTPDNAVLSIAGDFEPGEARRMIEKLEEVIKKVTSPANRIGTYLSNPARETAHIVDTLAGAIRTAL